MKIYDTIIIGGGQAGLSVAYFLRRSGLNYLILDDQEKPGGAWLQTWECLVLFSPTQYNSLSGWQMPMGKREYPTRNEFINYLTAYEERYKFPVERPNKVRLIEKEEDTFKLHTQKGHFYAKTVVSATGTAQNPLIPQYPGQIDFNGLQIHSVDYRNTQPFIGKKVLVVGGGNSGAQILAEVSKVAETKWVSLQPPHFLPADIDGHHLFNQATHSYLNKDTDTFRQQVSLSDIVQVESVKDGLNRCVYQSVRPFKVFYKEGVIWENGEKEKFDAVIWCTGFRPFLPHLKGLNVMENNRVRTQKTRSVIEPSLWLVGYGNWTGFASATIYGVGKTARDTAREIEAYLKSV